MQASWIEPTYKDRRLTRNFGSSTLVCTTIPSLSKLKGKATRNRGKIGSGKKKKEAVKVNSRVVKIRGISRFYEDLYFFIV